MDKIAIRGRKGVGGSALVHLFDTMTKRQRRVGWVTLYTTTPCTFNQSGGEINKKAKKCLKARMVLLP